MRDEPVKIYLRLNQVSQSAWDEFCSGKGLALSENGWFASGGLRAGCNRSTATFTGPGAVPVAVAFWLCFGGRISVSDQLQGEVDAVLRERCLAGSARIDLSHFGWSRRLQAWVAWASEGAIPLRILTGRVVNLGTKDGMVYEGARVTCFDYLAGTLVIEGGMCGRPRFEPGGAEPLDGRDKVFAHDIARGYVHPVVAA